MKPWRHIVFGSYIWLLNEIDKPNGLERNFEVKQLWNHDCVSIISTVTYLMNIPFLAVKLYMKNVEGFG